MMCLCIKTHYNMRDFSITFYKGRHYKHLGAREMLGENNKIVAFGKLDNWKEYFEEPQETRDRKLTELGI